MVAMWRQGIEDLINVSNGICNRGTVENAIIRVPIQRYKSWLVTKTLYVRCSSLVSRESEKLQSIEKSVTKRFEHNSRPMTSILNAT